MLTAKMIQRRRIENSVSYVVIGTHGWQQSDERAGRGQPVRPSAAHIVFLVSCDEPVDLWPIRPEGEGGATASATHCRTRRRTRYRRARRLRRYPFAIRSGAPRDNESLRRLP